MAARAAASERARVAAMKAVLAFMGRFPIGGRGTVTAPAEARPRAERIGLAEGMARARGLVTDDETTKPVIGLKQQRESGYICGWRNIAIQFD